MIIEPIINEKKGIGEQLFYQIGNNGPLILIITNLVLLRKKSTFFVYYLIGYVFNILLNQCLKIFFFQPRPSVDQKVFDLAMKQIKNVNSFTNLISYDAVLGMPSGHAQGIFYSTTFIFLVLTPISNNIIFFYIFITFITVFQRVYYKFHTIGQIFVGAFIGIGYAYCLFLFANNQKKGILKERAEEYGPI